jgi:hypothetical protein
LSYAENWRFASNLFMKSMAAHPSAALRFPSAVDSTGWLAFAPESKASARFRRFFPILSMGLGRQEDSRYFFQPVHSKQRDSAAAGYKLLGASFAQHRRPLCAKTVASTPSLRFWVSASR